MEYTNPKIRYYRVRTFSEKLNITFDYLRENWRVILRFSLYLLLPLCIFQAFALNSYVSTYVEFLKNPDHPKDFLMRFVLQGGVYILFYMIGNMVLSSFIYGLMHVYDYRPERLTGLMFGEFKGTFLRFLCKCVRIILFYSAITIMVGSIAGALAAWSIWAVVVYLLFVAIGGLIIMSPMALFGPMYLFEDRPFFETLQRAFRYGMSFWLEIFGILFIFGLIGSIINTVTYLPWYLVVVVAQLFTLTSPDSAIDQSLWYQLLVYVLGIIQSYGSYIAQIVGLIGIAFEYFHIREKREGVTVETEISNFANL
ncbi:hypothetical protein [Tannerella sp.]|uniref:hypothetical protein n=1 Tax=Tannerella sp. TaxID=2382127 RepID=UPI0026DA6FA3|nr:hypothetical protein [Tannerella sp.]MDO4704325.1 hypothetical protein [Tannerella sp.]